MTPDACVDVVMPTLDEEAYIEGTLDAIFAQTVPVVVTVVDNGSRDGTLELLRARAARDRRLVVLSDGTRRTVPDALNYALAHSTRPFVARVDARTIPAPDFLEHGLAVLDEDPAIGCAGGHAEQFGETRFGEAVARARSSPFGVGASGYADRRARADVDTVGCGIYRRAALEGVGGFDPVMQCGEDEEVNWRIRRAGWRIVRDTRIRFRYLARPTWVAAYAQYRNYGRARAAVAAKHPGFLRPHHLAPSAALVTLVALAMAAPFWRPARLALTAYVAVYAAGALAAAARSCADDTLRIPVTAAAFTALHAGYGVGMTEALLARKGRFS